MCRDATGNAHFIPASSTCPSASPTSSTPSGDPIAAEIEAGGHPDCASVVGESWRLVIRGVNANGSIDLRCVTGDSPETDNTGAGSIDCEANDTHGTGPIWYWASKDPTTLDQHVYAVKRGGKVKVVPHQTAKYFFTIGGGLASVMLAVGVC
jgi:hypothetical protein